MLHLVILKKLPYSTEEVKTVCSSCRTCAELKPHFHRPKYKSYLSSINFCIFIIDALDNTITLLYILYRK